MHDFKHTIANGAVGMLAAAFGITTSMLSEIEITLRIVLAILSICVMAITLRNLIRGKRPGDGPGAALHPLAFAAAVGLTFVAMAVRGPDGPPDDSVGAANLAQFTTGMSMPDLARLSSPILLALGVNIFAAAMKRVPERFVPDWTIPFMALVLGAVFLPALDGWTARNCIVGFASGGLAVGLNQALRQGLSALTSSAQCTRPSK